MPKIMLIRILLGAVLAVFLNPTTAMANGGTQNYDVVGTEATWRWHLVEDSINELNIYENGSDFPPEGYDYDATLNWDGFDSFGIVSINNSTFDTNGGSATISGGSVTFTDTDHPGDTLNYQFQNNWYQTTVSLDAAGSIKLYGNLGSDGGTTWTTIGGKLFSYEIDEVGGGVDKDPIFYWPTPPTTYTNGNDNPELVVSGTSLTFKLHAFAHQENISINPLDYMAKFAQFASENINRTDIFNYATWSPAPAPAPVYVRQSSNLTFAQSLYASDTLSDPDGQLRATVDQVMSKYGSLIK
jgi:hypothetical protein